MVPTIEPIISPSTLVEGQAVTDIVSIADIGEWLNLSSSMVTAKTGMLTSLLESSVDIAEGYTWLYLLRRTVVSEYDLSNGLFAGFCNGNVNLLLNRAPIISLDDITSIEYLDDTDTYVAFDRGTEAATGLFDNVTERSERRQWATIYLRDPIDFQPRYNAYKIRVTYTSGYTAATVPAGIKTALKMMVASDFTDRGDCGCEINGFPVPCAAKKHLDRYSISGTVFSGLSGGCCG